MIAAGVRYPHNIMQKNRIVLTSDSAGRFFLVYKCVNDVSSYGTFYFDESTLDERCDSVHLRSGEESFVNQMTRRLHPLYDSSSHLSFPTTSLNNVTTRGWDVDPIYYAAVQAAYLGHAFGRFGHVRTQFTTNNRNYTALIHGVENRRACLSAMERMESLKFSRNCSFPPLTWNVTYEGDREGDVVCRSQIYDNSFALNTQRQTDDSLRETSKCILSHMLKFATVDFSVNHLCAEREVQLRRNLSYPEKCQLLVFLEVARRKWTENSERFQAECGRFSLREYDDSFTKNMFGTKRATRNNPELSDLLHRLPAVLRDAVTSRWKKESKQVCTSDGRQSCNCPVPSDLTEWTVEHVHMVVDCLVSDRCRKDY